MVDRDRPLLVILVFNCFCLYYYFSCITRCHLCDLVPAADAALWFSFYVRIVRSCHLVPFCQADVPPYVIGCNRHCIQRKPWILHHILTLNHTPLLYSLPGVFFAKLTFILIRIVPSCEKCRFKIVWMACCEF